MSLQGKSFALVALDRPQLFDITTALDAVQAEWQAFGRAPEASRLTGFSAVICSAAAAVDAALPTLVVGPVEEMAAHTGDDRDYVVAPPLHVEELLLRLSRLISTSKRARSLAPVTTPVVLAADDDPTTTAIVRAVTTQNAMTCHVANDGRRALELAKSLAPNIIVLDVNMPHLDGFEVLSALRGDAATASIPVVMLTSVQQEADVVRGFSLGADDYVVKPFNPMELLARIKRLVRR